MGKGGLCQSPKTRNKGWIQARIGMCEKLRHASVSCCGRGGVAENGKATCKFPRKHRRPAVAVRWLMSQSLKFLQECLVLTGPVMGCLPRGRTNCPNQDTNCPNQDPTVRIRTPTVRIRTPTVRIRTPTVRIWTPTVRIRTHFFL